MDLGILGARMDAIKQSVDRISSYRSQLISGNLGYLVAGEIIQLPESVKTKLIGLLDAELYTLFDTVNLLKKEVAT